MLRLVVVCVVVTGSDRSFCVYHVLGVRACMTHRKASRTPNLTYRENNNIKAQLSRRFRHMRSHRHCALRGCSNCPFFFPCHICPTTNILRSTPNNRRTRSRPLLPFAHPLRVPRRATTQRQPDQAEAPRILFVVTSFDRGRRLGLRLNSVDKLDYVLMIMDEIRGACEVGGGGG